MIERGDHSQDIAAWFGLNIGRVADVKRGRIMPHVSEADVDELPPPGPYPSLKKLFEMDNSEYKHLISSVRSDG